jgi:hypothetical protein
LKNLDHFGNILANPYENMRKILENIGKLLANPRKTPEKIFDNPCENTGKTLGGNHLEKHGKPLDTLKIWGNMRKT